MPAAQAWEQAGVPQEAQVLIRELVSPKVPDQRGGQNRGCTSNLQNATEQGLRGVEGSPSGQDRPAPPRPCGGTVDWRRLL